MTGAVPRDPGLQEERTALAWRRTVVSGVAGTGLVALTAGRVGLVAVAVLAALLAVGLAVAVIRQVRRPRTLQDAPWPVLVLAGGTVIALGALGLATATASILGRPS